MVSKRLKIAFHHLGVYVWVVIYVHHRDIAATSRWRGIRLTVCACARYDIKRQALMVARGNGDLDS